MSFPAPCNPQDLFNPSHVNSLTSNRPNDFNIHFTSQHLSQIQQVKTVSVGSPLPNIGYHNTQARSLSPECTIARMNFNLCDESWR